MTATRRLLPETLGNSGDYTASQPAGRVGEFHQGARQPEDTAEGREVVMPQIGWDILSETEINDMMRLLDPCVLPSPPVRSSPYVNPYALPANSGVPQKPAGRAISQKQLQALTKKHLLLMLRDSEKELAQAKELLEAYQAMLGRGQGTGGRRLYE